MGSNWASKYPTGNPLRFPSMSRNGTWSLGDKAGSIAEVGTSFGLTYELFELRAEHC